MGVVMEICIEEIGFNQINRSKPLWQGLNALHHECSVNFKERYQTLTFEKRMEDIEYKSRIGEVKIYLLKKNNEENAIGFCICSMAAGKGVLDSIYIANAYRKQGCGGRLIEKALQWFDENNISDISIDVVYANDEALPFYERYGFLIWAYKLRKK